MNIIHPDLPYEVQPLSNFHVLIDVRDGKILDIDEHPEDLRQLRDNMNEEHYFNEVIKVV